MNTLFKTVALSILFAGTTVTSTAQITPGSPANFIAIYTTGDEGIIDFNQGISVVLGGYNFTVYWENINNPSENGTLTFVSPGNLELSGLMSNTDYKIEITGSLPRIPRPLYGELKELKQWGNIQWKDLASAFSSVNNRNMIMTATDAPDLSQMIPIGYTDPKKSLAGMFEGCTQFNSDISHWDVSTIQIMSRMFKDAKAFNQDISSWDVSKVEEMGYMFDGATAFNQPLNEWNTGKVKTMSGMFRGAKSFNQSLGTFTLKSIEYGYINILHMILDTNIDCDNYSSTLVGWANNPDTPDSLRLDLVSSDIAGNRVYSDSPDVVTARNKLVNDKKWQIAGDKQSMGNGCANSNSGEGGGNPPDGSKNTINELNIEQVTIFPNPSTEMLILNGLQGSTQLIITGINGKTVFSTETENETEIVPISNLVSGMYLLHVHSENVQGTKKFVKE